MSNNAEERRFDVRLIESRVRRGTVTAEEYKKFLDSLPDDSDNAEHCKAQFSPSFAAAHYRKG